MFNLLSNAIKFTPHGGAIKLVVNKVNHLGDLSINDETLTKVVKLNPNKTFLEI